MAQYPGAALACAESLTALAELGEQLDDDLWARPTDCPGWTVGQVYAHIIGIERWVADGSVAYEGPLQDWIDAPISARDGVARTAVLAELRSLIPVRHKQLADASGEVFNALLRRIVPIDLSLRMRAFDLWIHEQDVRHAAGLPGNQATTSAAITRDMFLAALPRIVAKDVKAPPQSSVRMSVLGALPFDVTVVVGDDGRGAVAVNPSETPTAHLRLEWVAFSRLAAGRGSRADHEVSVTGDAELGERVLAHLNIAP